MNDGEQIIVRAVKTQQGDGVDVYAFFLFGSDISRIADITRIARDDGELKGFQRKEIRNHVNSIVEFLDSGPVVFPNAIILAMSPEVEFKFSRGSRPDGMIEVADSGNLMIPVRPEGKRVAWIVDGQQRSLAFTHGCSVDHIIFDFDESLCGMEGGSKEAKRRFEITLGNAEAFFEASRRLSNQFTPLGVVQGWSPGSMAEAARRLYAMGYRYLAVGGTVPLKSTQIKACLRAIRDAVPADTRLHILGFAKADDIAEFVPFDITSFDTTSPLLRAFKDAKSNYYLPAEPGRLTYYTAIRVPQALENPKLKKLAKAGVLRQEELSRLERSALSALRAYDKEGASLEETLGAVLAYAVPAEIGARLDDLPGAKTVAGLRERYRRTLEDRPWKQCSCAICSAISIEVVIFRAGNRNKRRGIHNLGVFKGLVDSLSKKESVNEETDLPCHSGASKRVTRRAVVRGERSRAEAVGDD